ncbi:hypothetical protein DPMN_117873 [Dreissena polymorpha]|uniref:Uncharacterized protein n=1 Tax=Dreissena polymorpha TaxID=45954 RepID=A0A9D4GJ59_DREPO|nr:hypothetical protein DPMN_117873 [Dreissena polymorpha]
MAYTPIQSVVWTPNSSVFLLGSDDQDIPPWLIHLSSLLFGLLIVQFSLQDLMTKTSLHG